MKRIKYLIAGVCALLATASYAQQLHFSGTLQNMHLWRGLQVADGGVLAADLNVGFLDDGLKVGLWGGSDFTGDYKEFDYYLSYSRAGFTVAVWDIRFPSTAERTISAAQIAIGLAPAPPNTSRKPLAIKSTAPLSLRPLENPSVPPSTATVFQSIVRNARLQLMQLDAMQTQAPISATVPRE